MNILGIAQGTHASAAVIRDDRILSTVWGGRGEGVEDVQGLPWVLMDKALRHAGMQRGDIDVVAVAGRYDPMAVVERQVGLFRHIPGGASLFGRVQAVGRTALRRTGLGAWVADQAEEHLDELLREEGFEASRVATVDVHRALAQGAYRMQENDEALVVTLHSADDGVGLAVHVGMVGQLDLVRAESDVAALHLHLALVVDLLGVAHLYELDTLGAAGRPHGPTLDLLRQRVWVEGLGVAASSWLDLTGRDTAVLDAFEGLSPEDAAATIMERVVEVSVELIRAHLARWGHRTVVLVGAAYALPHVVGQVVRRVREVPFRVMPSPGRAALALGAAADLAGMSPHRRPFIVGPQVDPRERGPVSGDWKPCSAARVGALLGAGAPVLVARGPAGPGLDKQGRRVVWVNLQGDRGVQALLRQMGLSEHTLRRGVVQGTAELPTDLVRRLGANVAQGAVRIPMPPDHPLAGAAPGPSGLPLLDVGHDPLRARILQAAGPVGVVALPVAVDGVIRQSTRGLARAATELDLAAMVLGELCLERR